MKTKTTEHFSPFSITRVRLELEAGYSSLFDAEVSIINSISCSDIAQMCDDFIKRTEELDGHGFEYNGKLTVVSHHGHQQIFTDAYPARTDPVVKAALKEEFTGLASIFAVYARTMN